MNNIEFRDLMLAIVQSYPSTARQIKTFAVVDVERSYDADNLLKFSKDYQGGDFWNRKWVANGASENTLTNTYPTLTITSNAETIEGDYNTACQKVNATYLVEIVDVKDCPECQLYRTISKLNDDLLTQARWVIKELQGNATAKQYLSFNPIQLRLFDFGIDDLRGVQFEITFEYSNANYNLP
jgi:hypothetical protein